MCLWFTNTKLIMGMLQSRAVAKENPSNSCNTMLILGIGKDFVTNLLFTTSPKSLWKCMVLFFVGTINDGDANLDVCCFSSTPSLHSLLTSLMRTSLCIFDTRKIWPWYGIAPSLNWNETGLVFHSPKVQSNSVSYFLRSCSNYFWCFCHLDACNCLWQLTGNLLCYICHLIFVSIFW